MIHNANIRKLVIINLLSRIGLTIFSKMNELILIEKGVHKEIISLTTTINIPIQIILLIFIRNENKTIMQNIINSFYYLIIASIANLLILVSYDKLIQMDLKILTIVLGIGISIIFANVYKILTASTQSFMNKICDRDIGASYLTAMVSVINLSDKWPGVFIFTAVNYLGFETVCLISIIYTVAFYFFSKNMLIELSELKSESWKLDNKEGDDNSNETNKNK